MLNVDTGACSFIDQYVKCINPDDEELAPGIQRPEVPALCHMQEVQVSLPPSPETVIAHQSTVATIPPQKKAELTVKALATVDDMDTPEHFSIDKLLSKVCDP